MSQANSVLWRRLAYMLSPQLDIYKSIAPHLAGENVLEIGFGTGFGTLQLTPYVRMITAIEIDRDAFAFACANLPLPNVWWRNVDITQLAEEELYDSVVMIEVLEHIEDWRGALMQVVTSLKSGGRLFMTARNANADLRKNDLHERELTAAQTLRNLGWFFADVKLFDYSLTRELDASTRQTPLLAVAVK